MQRHAIVLDTTGYDRYTILTSDVVEEKERT